MEYDFLHSTGFYPQKSRTPLIVLLTIAVTIATVLLLFVMIMLFQRAKIDKASTLCTAKPSPPTDIIIGNNKSNSFKIEWSRILDVSYYNVYVGLTSNFPRNAAIYKTTNYSATAEIVDLPKNVTYYYYLTATNGCGESVNSIEYSFYYS